MAMTQFKDLDPIMHSQLRLAIVSLLMSVEEAEFSFLQEKTQATSGNLSIQITKLKEAGYIEVTKKFRGNYPLTLCHITPVGKQKFAEYVKALKDYLNPGK
jgi:DNA-binding transcriptional ArsR family regulator